MNKILLPTLIALLSFSSCSDYPCSPATITYDLIGFTDAEADTIVLKKYTKNTTTLIDSFYFTENFGIRFSRSGDTLSMASFNSQAILHSLFDYELSFPGASRIFRLTEINEEQSYLKKGLFNNTKEGCINQITSYKENGLLKNTVLFNTIYLKK